MNFSANRRTLVISRLCLLGFAKEAQPRFGEVCEIMDTSLLIPK